MADQEIITCVETAIAAHGRDPGALLPLLHAIHNRFRYLPPEALETIPALTSITPAQISSVVSFYPHFRLRPAGRHRIRLCDGTACHVKGSSIVFETLAAKLQIPDGDDTDPTRNFTLEKVACLGCCTLAPVMQIDGITYGHLTVDRIRSVLDDFLAERGREGLTGMESADSASTGRAEIRVGLGSCCMARGSANVMQAFAAAAGKLGGDVLVKRVGCVGMCHQTPLVVVQVPGQKPASYAQVTPDDVDFIIRRHFPSPSLAGHAQRGMKRILTSLMTGTYDNPASDKSMTLVNSGVKEFQGPQCRFAMGGSDEIDPLDLEEYRRHGGFSALLKCRDGLAPDQIIGMINSSGLRGRGGAGFPTGRKWHMVRTSPGSFKHIICNGDEGDPGAYMDRMLLESVPYRIIEGMCIAGIAVGASEGIFYIRSEYGLAVARVRAALEQCRRAGVISGAGTTGVGFSIRIVEGAGAFVCGEETAMIASIEGQRGMPRWRPPYPSTAGLHGNPTLINNVETLALVPVIINEGPAVFSARGTTASRGTKVFALAGKIVRAGLVEVPMGITIGDIVNGIGGGVGEGRQFKAIQVGGPSGGCLPASLAGLPIDYEALTHAGAIMGSGGLVVLDDTDCMVEMARYFLDFTQNQSCGKCTFCRVGTRRMLEIMDRLCAGKGKPEDLETLETMGQAIKRSSICGLGRTAPNPVLTTLRYFRDEYEAHIQGRCPAGKCRQLIRYEITDTCIGCTICAQHCPADAIPFTPYQKHIIDQSKCIKCDVCRIQCPEKAIVIR